MIHYRDCAFDKRLMVLEHPSGITFLIGKSDLKIYGVTGIQPAAYNVLIRLKKINVEGIHKICGEHVTYVENMVICEKCKEVMELS